jgi:omega-amidase
MRAHLVQMDLTWEDRAANRRRARALIDRIAQKGQLQPGDMVILPELFDTGFSFNLDVTADVDQSTFRFIIEEASRRRITLVGSRTVLGPEGKGRNRCTVAAPDGSIICEYDKVHPFSFGRESEHFLGGSRIGLFDWLPIEAFIGGSDEATERRSDGGKADTSATASPPPAPVPSAAGTRVCPTICYDLRFPELFRAGLLGGAEVYTVIANWPSVRASHRRALAIARAIENQAYVLCVNRAGNDPHLKYGGESFAVGPKGDILGELGGEEATLTIDLDLRALRQWRTDFPAWRDIKLLG